jgi:hypothetical protein
MQRYIVALALLLLANCTSPSPTAVEGKDRVALEMGAKAGQALAACELAVLDLGQCLAARDAWLDGAEEPECLVDAVPKQHEAYLSNAVGQGNRRRVDRRRHASSDVPAYGPAWQAISRSTGRTDGGNREDMSVSQVSISQRSASEASLHAGVRGRNYRERAPTISSADEVIETTEEQQADCATLADFLK